MTFTGQNHDPLQRKRELEDNLDSLRKRLEAVEGSRHVIHDIIDYLAKNSGLQFPVMDKFLKPELLCKREGIREAVVQLSFLLPRKK